MKGTSATSEAEERVNEAERSAVSRRRTEICMVDERKDREGRRKEGGSEEDKENEVEILSH